MAVNGDRRGVAQPGSAPALEAGGRRIEASRPDHVILKDNGGSMTVSSMTERTRRKVLSVTLDDCRVDTFRAGGHGGQNQNKRNSGVRVVHEPSGAVGEARDTRDQLHNKRSAFVRMARSVRFQTWARVEAMTQPEDILVEVGEAAVRD